MTLFSREDYEYLVAKTFRADYPGFRPGVVEAPNGDGKLDLLKQYSHVAPKYMQTSSDSVLLRAHYERALSYAQAVHRRLGWPAHLAPSYEHCAMRVLKYPPGAYSHWHTDFDLFTTLLYRNRPGLVREGYQDDDVSEGLHFGEIAVEAGLVERATPHHVPPQDNEQHSIVFFAVPSHHARLPGTLSVGEWLDERKSRSRYPNTNNSKGTI